MPYFKKNNYSVKYLNIISFLKNHSFASFYFQYSLHRQKNYHKENDPDEIDY